MRLTESILKNLNEDRYIYDDNGNYEEDLQIVSNSFEEFMNNEASKLLGKKSYYDGYEDHYSPNTRFLKAITNYIESKSSSIKILTKRVSHDYDIGNNNAYEIAKVVENDFEHIGYLNWNYDIYGDDVACYITNKKGKQVSKHFYEIFFTSISRDGEVDMSLDNVNEAEFTITNPNGAWYLDINDKTIAITDSVQKCLNTLRKYKYKITSKEDNFDDNGGIKGTVIRK